MNEPTDKPVVSTKEINKSDTANVSSKDHIELILELGASFHKDVNLDVSALDAKVKVNYFKDPIVPEVIKFDHKGSSVCVSEIRRAETEFAPILANNPALLFRDTTNNSAFQVKADTPPMEELDVEGDKTKLIR